VVEAAGLVADVVAVAAGHEPVGLLDLVYRGGFVRKVDWKAQTDRETL
jgi:hypothetical protein